MMYFDFVYGIYVDTREKTNRESARIRPSGEANRICFSSLSLVGSSRKAKPCSAKVVDFVANPLDPPARPFIGTVRTNPVGAPAPPIIDLPLNLIS